MALPAKLPDSASIDNAPYDFPPGFERKLRKIVDDIDADEVTIDAIDKGTEDVTWVVLIKFDKDRMTEQMLDDVYELIRKVTKRKQIQRISDDAQGQYKVRLEYNPR